MKLTEKLDPSGNATYLFLLDRTLDWAVVSTNAHTKITLAINTADNFEYRNISRYGIIDLNKECPQRSSVEVMYKTFWCEQHKQFL